MTCEDQFMAIKAIAPDACLKLREPGDWYLRMPGLEIGGDGMLRGVGGNGSTPEEAIQAAWSELTDIPPGRFVAVGGYSDKRKNVRWNGFMWEDVPL